MNRWRQFWRWITGSRCRECGAPAWLSCEACYIEEKTP